MLHLTRLFYEYLLPLFVHVRGWEVFEGPCLHGGVPADVMVVRTRPSVHGNSLPQTLPNSKLLTKGRYELSSVRSSSTYPQYPE